jgi:hypothetical protein
MMGGGGSEMIKNVILIQIQDLVVEGKIIYFSLLEFRIRFFYRIFGSLKSYIKKTNHHRVHFIF